MKEPAPAAPTNLTVVPNVQGRSNLVHWTDHAVNESGYTLTISSSPMYDDILLVNLPADSTAYEDVAAVAGVRYRYGLIANGAVVDSAAVAVESRAIHLYETWRQATSLPQFDDPDTVRPSTYDLAPGVDISYGNVAPNVDGVFSAEAEAIIRGQARALPAGGLLVDDIETWHVDVERIGTEQVAIDAAVDASVAVHRRWAAIARDENPDLNLGIYNATAKLEPSFTAEEFAAAAYATERLIDGLFQPGIHFDLATPPIYANGDDFGAWQALADADVKTLQRNGVRVVPFYCERAILGSERNLANDELDQICELIFLCGNEALRWDGYLTPWSSTRASLQAHVIDYLSSR